MKRRHGFTLVELLVVVAVIALLLAILLPSLNKAKQQAQAVSCASQLRQIGTAFYAYASENQGYLTPFNLHKTSPASESAQIPYNYWADLLVNGGYLGSGNEVAPYDNKGKYRKGVLMCPTAMRIPNKAGAYTWASTGGSYGVNISHRSDPNLKLFDYAYSRSFSQLRRTSQTLLLTETREQALTDPITENQRPSYLYCPLHPGSSVDWVVGTEEASPRHIGMTINTLRMDGHVTVMQPYDEIRNDADDMFAHYDAP